MKNDKRSRCKERVEVRERKTLEKREIRKLKKRFDSYDARWITR